MKKLFLGIVLVLIAFGAGVIISKSWFKWPNPTVIEQQSAILEKINAVNKLVTIEGVFSEIYDYKDYYGYDWWPFRKKALIRVKARIIAGYDLSQATVESFPDEKRIVISNVPHADIISTEHDLDYYDISDGTFNRFSREDLNALNAKAKSFVIEQAKESQLLEKAEVQGKHLLETLQFMVESSGWSLELIRSENEKQVLLKD